MCACVRVPLLILYKYLSRRISLQFLQLVSFFNSISVPIYFHFVIFPATCCLCALPFYSHIHARTIAYTHVCVLRQVQLPSAFIWLCLAENDAPFATIFFFFFFFLLLLQFCFVAGSDHAAFVATAVCFMDSYCLQCAHLRCCRYVCYFNVYPN